LEIASLRRFGKTAKRAISSNGLGRPFCWRYGVNPSPFLDIPILIEINIATMAIKRRVFLASGAAAAAVAANQLLNPKAGRSAERVVNLYSARHYGSDTAIYESFTKKTGIKVNLVESPGDKLIERVKSEGANSPADVIITRGTSGAPKKQVYFSPCLREF
jgi:hypothetical protein